MSFHTGAKESNLGLHAAISWPYIFNPSANTQTSQIIQDAEAKESLLALYSLVTDLEVRQGAVSRPYGQTVQGLSNAQAYI